MSWVEVEVLVYCFKVLACVARFAFEALMSVHSMSNSIIPNPSNCVSILLFFLSRLIFQSSNIDYASPPFLECVATTSFANSD